MRRLLPSLLLLATLPVAAGETVRFVSCAVYRDTDAGRKSGCWLGTDGATGRRYDVTDAPFKPSVGRMMLVEGEVAGTRDICGGAPLAPVRVAVLDEPCPEVVIPAEGYPSKPSVVPATAMAPLSVPRVLPPPPYSRQQYHVEVTIEKASLYAKASKGRVEVVGYADSEGFMASGRRMREPRQLAGARADMVREALVRLGVPAGRIALRTDTHPVALADWPAALAMSSKRRVTITVTP
jgi:hypothetical protein